MDTINVDKNVSAIIVIISTRKATLDVGEQVNGLFDPGKEVAG